MTDIDQEIGSYPTPLVSRLAKPLASKRFRHSFMARQLKLFLAEQIRALRGSLTQAQFGSEIGKPQSVVSRLEKQADRQISIQTLIDIAERRDIAVIIRFVDFPAFLALTSDYSDAALSPSPYDQSAIDQLASAEKFQDREQALKALFSPKPETLKDEAAREFKTVREVKALEGLGAANDDYLKAQGISSSALSAFQ